MKKLMKSFALLAVAALGLSACNDDKLVPDNGNADGKFVTVHFGAEAAIEGATKATLTPDEGETAFQAAWEKGDEISIEYISPEYNNDIITGTWDATNKKFSANLPNEKGAWDYQAAYPVPSASDNSVDFGPNRTQKGNAYNSKYDIMIGATDTKDSEAGKDDNGNDIVFPMTRQTAIAYFHFTSALDEAVTSATLKVTDGAIANSSASINEQFKFVAPQENDLTEINLTFEEGTAPSAKDFQLWFNVLPTIYKSITLTVETATKTFTISKDATENLAMYEAGKLYKVKKSGIAWMDKVVTPSGPTITKITSASEFTAGTYIIMTYDESYYVPNAAATNAGPELVNVVKTDGVITITPEMIWNATVSGEGLEFTSYVEPGKKLWGAPKNDGVRVSDNSTADNPSSVWKLETLDNYGPCGYAAGSGTAKYYLSTYGTKDWRNYKSSNLSTTNKAANFFKVEGWVDSNHSISIATVDGGTLSASPRSAAEGTEVTLTATPDEGYEFNNDWTVTNAETSDAIKVTDGKFTMPAANVNVTASFKQLSYAITANPAENGTYTVKVGEEEVTSAVYGAKVLLEATPAEGYICDGWTVVDAESNSVYVSNNSFTMPASAVAISTTFSVKPEDITYDHAGTAEDPYSVADVLKYISTLGTATSTEDVYVKGIISSISEVSTSYGNATYFIKDEGVENEVKVFRGLYLDGAKFTSANQIGVGDEVVVVGKVLDYNGTPEVNSGNKIVSISKAPYLKATASKETGISAAGETVTITVDTNVDSWTATSDNGAFVVGTPSGNTVDVVVSKNTDATERTATITVTAGTLSETITLTQKAAGAADDVIETIDFESVSTDYSFWTFTNMTSKQTGSITANGGTYYGTTGGKTTASITTKSEIASPKSITFYVSKQSTNTTSSSWKIQVSSDNATWTDVKTQSATTMSKGSWVKVTQDLSSYSNVYVRVYYTGSTAVRNIDDLSLTYSN